MKPIALILQLLRQHLALASRVDALTQLVTLLAVQAGSDAATVRRGLRETGAAALQKALERVEDRNPGLAAQLAAELPQTELDLDLLELLRWEEEDGAAADDEGQGVGS